MLKSLGIGPERVGGGQGELIEHPFGGPHGVRWKRGDTTGKPSDEIVELGVR